MHRLEDTSFCVWNQGWKTYVLWINFIESSDWKNHQIHKIQVSQSESLVPSTKISPTWRKVKPRSWTWRFSEDVTKYTFCIYSRKNGIFIVHIFFNLPTWTPFSNTKGIASSCWDVKFSLRITSSSEMGHRTNSMMFQVHLLSLVPAALDVDEKIHTFSVYVP